MRPLALTILLTACSSAPLPYDPPDCVAIFDQILCNREEE